VLAREHTGQAFCAWHGLAKGGVAVAFTWLLRSHIGALTEISRSLFIKIAGKNTMPNQPQ
jgi:hypothetical protein